MTAVPQLSLRADLARTWSLAWPVFLVYLVSIAMSTIDVIMVGQASSDELAFLGIGRVMYWMVLTIGGGLMSGITVFTARADGAGKHGETGQIWRQGVFYSGILSLSAVLILAAVTKPLLSALQLPEALVVQGTEYVLMTALGLPFQFFIMASFLYLEGISRPRPGMVVMLSTLPLNAALNWVFIEGNLGAPALGATGAALATALAQMLGALLIFIYVRNMPGRESYGLSGSWKHLWRDSKPMRNFGYAPGFATGMEFLGFNAINLMTGYISIQTVGAYQVVFSLHALSFAIAMGVASATAVRVGNAIGREDPHAVRRQVKLSAVLTALVILPFTLLYLVAPMLALTPFGAEADVLAIARVLLLIIAPFLVFDGWQYMLTHALRAAGDQIFSSILQVTSFLVVMTGAGALLAFTFGYGAPGLSYGLVLGMVCAAVLLGWRFVVVSRRLIQAQETS